MQRLVIINYGSGNLHSAAKAFERAARESEADVRIEVAPTPRLSPPPTASCCRASALRRLQGRRRAVAGMREALEKSVRERQRPFLGICVGAQLMAGRGLEFRITPGFGWIEGDVKAIEPRDPALKIPHMGWNTLRVVNDHPLLAGIETGPDGQHAYFVHSFHLVPADRGALVAEADYGGPVTAMVGVDNIAGTQFHPEKSQTLGLRLISNFLKWGT